MNLLRGTIPSEIGLFDLHSLGLGANSIEGASEHVMAQADVASSSVCLTIISVQEKYPQSSVLWKI